MYIDFEDLRPETPRVERALSVREGVLISIIVHLLLFIALLTVPDLLPQSTRAVRTAVENRVPQQNPRFIFVQPRLDISKPQPKPNVCTSKNTSMKLFRWLTAIFQTRNFGGIR